MDQCLNTSKDLTPTVVIKHCIILQEGDEIHPFALYCRLPTHEAQTLGSCNAYTTICYTVPKNRPRPDAARRSVTHICLSIRAISSTRAALTSVIQALLRPLRLTSVTLSMPEAKMLVRLSTRWLHVTSVPYTSELCRCVSAGTLSVLARNAELHLTSETNFPSEPPC